MARGITPHMSWLAILIPLLTTNVSAILDAKGTSLLCTPPLGSVAPQNQYCGVNMLLTMDLPINLSLSSKSTVSCSLNQIKLSNVSLIQDGLAWKAQLGYTIQLGDRDSEVGTTKIQCQVKKEDDPTTLSIEDTLPIAIYAYPPEIDVLEIVTDGPSQTPGFVKNVTKSHTFIQNLGIGAKVGVNIITKSRHSVSGKCLLSPLNQVIAISDSQGSYVITGGDPRVEKDALQYQCNTTDIAGNIAKSSGRALMHEIALDGTLPTIESIFMVFSSETPANIGSMVTVTLKAQNFATGYTGNCIVNGVGSLEMVEQTGDDKKGLYAVQYHVKAGNHDIGINGSLPIECHFENEAKNSNFYSGNARLSFSIDANAPKIMTTKMLFSTDNPAHVGTVIEIQIKTSQEEKSLEVHQEECEINNVPVARSFTRSGPDTYLLTYVMGEGHAMWKPGKLPIRCTLMDSSANTVLVNHFTDDNTLFAREMKAKEFDLTNNFASYFPTKSALLSFIIVAVASHTFGNFCPFLGLPRITGYLATGIIAGPYVLKLITTDDTLQMRMVDEASLAFIGLAAGAKLHWADMRRKLKSIVCVTLWLTFFEYVIGTLTIIVLANHLVFLQSTTSAECYAIAMLAGCMMIARSPSSALAVIEETRSQGIFTNFIFSVTVLCDAVVIVLFNINSIFAEALLSNKSVSSKSVQELLAQMFISIGTGVAIGKLMSFCILWRTPRIRRKSRLFVLIRVAKQACLLVFGSALFVLGHFSRPYLEPLLCCTVAGATLWNWNISANREELGLLLKKMADFVYVGFFTLTGATLELDMLLKALGVALCLCLTRIFAIFCGAYIGGSIAKEKPEYSKVSWMAYITQAGVTLGLAKKIQLLYPGWGSYFATMIVAVVICNQLIGPPLLRIVLRRVGDCRRKENGKVDGLRALLLGDDKRLSVVNSAKRRMINCGWEPFSFTMALKDAEDALEMQVQLREALKLHEPLDVVVVMMSSDVLNFRVVRSLAHICTKTKRIKVLRIVVNVVGDDGEAGWASRFASMPSHEENGDAIDVVVVDRHEATDMLIELAACGKLINQKEILSPRSHDCDEKEEVIKVNLSSKMRQMLWV